MHVVLLDINNLLCRAYFANAKLQAGPYEVGGIFGLSTYLQNICNLLQPTHIAMARDLGSKTWRHHLYPDYKGKRGKTEDDLRHQFKLLPHLARHMDIMMVDMYNFEADDCIGTLATQASKLGLVTIVSTDKDLCQLLGSNVRIYNPHSRAIQTSEDIESKYQVPIGRLTDYFALVGDTSDNLPGVPGIGPKAALEVLAACPDLMKVELYPFKPALKKKLNAQTDNIRLMKKMVTLSCDVDLKVPFTAETALYFQWLGGKTLSIDDISEWYAELNIQSEPAIEEDIFDNL